MSVFPSQTNFVTGDILTATAVNEIGEAINLLDGAQFAAGKNKIINGDFGINQRGFTTTTTQATYTFDRWRTTASEGGVTFTAQTFTPGAAPVSGYEGSNYIRLVTAGQTATGTFTDIRQRIESVRTLAGQTATISFWAKAASGTPKVALELQQGFAVGGSPNVQIYAGQVTLSTSWARYSLTVAIPSISGKTVGLDADTELAVEFIVSAGSNFNARTGSLGIQSNTFDIWGVQVEAGNQMTPFQTASGSIAGELALAQRYYYRETGGMAFSPYALGYTTTTTKGYALINLPQTMRVNPTSVEFSALGLNVSIGVVTALSALTLDVVSPSVATVEVTTASTWTAGINVRLLNNNNAAGYLGFNAEL